VTVATRGGRPRRSGIDLHCVRHLDVRDVTKLVGIPITAPARTLVDLCAVVPARKIEKAFEQAHVLRLIVPGAIEAALARSVGRRPLHSESCSWSRPPCRPSPAASWRRLSWHSAGAAACPIPRLELAGFPATRFTHYQVMHEPDDTLRRTSRLVLGQ
jgi:hypothetical protein